MPRTKVRKILQEGDRTTFYLKKGFPKEMLDWINGQSDMQLLFEYALDHLYQDIGPVDIAAILPRTYEVGQGFNAPEGIKPSPVEVRRVPAKDVTEVPPVVEEDGQPLQANSAPSFSDNEKEPFVPAGSKEASYEEENLGFTEEKLEVEKPNKNLNKTDSEKKNSWSGLSDLDDSGYM